jgi:diaminopimelate epimerase
MCAKEAILYHLRIGDTDCQFGAVSMGNPHAVIQVDNVATAPVTELGKQLESHAVFPERANIGFMQIINRQAIKLRVYERGAAETLACGSGACAAVVTGIEQGLLDSRVSVQLLGGSLNIFWEGRGTPVWMKGEAVTVFDGVIVL